MIDRIAPARGAARSASAQRGEQPPQQSFGAMLQQQLQQAQPAQQPLNFSKHAAKRLDERGIQLDSSLLGDLEHAVEQARQKGAKDVAVIGRQGVFIVNVPNNIVVTTMSQEDMKQRVFTNIDSAVLM